MTPVSDPIWEQIRAEAAEDAAAEPMLASFLHATVLNHSTLEDCLSFHLAGKLGSETLHMLSLREVFDEAMLKDPSIGEAARADLRAVVERDPACERYSIPLLYFKGFKALQSYRVAHWLWLEGRKALALQLQSRISELYGVDIHPGARIGRGIMIDHAHSIVIGETAVVGDDVSMLHEVTLGGTGKASGDRHPKVGNGVLIAAGAKVLGNVKIGEGAKIAAGSVVLHDVPPHSTAAGVPAVIVGGTRHAKPAEAMDHCLDSMEGVPDPQAARGR
jgi:serine O-acetyltransferase